MDKSIKIALTIMSITIVSLGGFTLFDKLNIGKNVGDNPGDTYHYKTVYQAQANKPQIIDTSTGKERIVPVEDVDMTLGDNIDVEEKIADYIDDYFEENKRHVGAILLSSEEGFKSFKGILCVCSNDEDKSASELIPTEYNEEYTEPTEESDESDIDDSDYDDNEDDNEDNNEDDDEDRVIKVLIFIGDSENPLEEHTIENNEPLDLDIDSSFDIKIVIVTNGYSAEPNIELRKSSFYDSDYTDYEDWFSNEI